MTEENNGSTFANEIAALKKQFDGIKSETEDFIASAKALSDKGVGEAKEALEAAKENWHGIVSSFENSPIAKLFAKAKKKVTAKKKSAPKAKAAAKKVVKKVAKKVAKKVTAKKKAKK